MTCSDYSLVCPLDGDRDLHLKQLLLPTKCGLSLPDMFVIGISQKAHWFYHLFYFYMILVIRLCPKLS